MADLPEFHHIHCSSRYDRSPASLEYDLDNWMASCDLITVTEVTNNQRAARLREKGWGYYNAKAGADADNCAIAWETATWHRVSGKVIRLSSNTFDRLNGMHNIYVWAATVVLRHAKTGHKLLVSCSHMPSHIEGAGGFNHTDLGWQARKQAFMTGLTNWSTHVKDQSKKQNIDAQLIVADWNVNLKADWVRQLLGNHWGADYEIAWKVMPTSGGALHGGPQAPAGSPGQGQHDSIIDGSLYSGLSVTKGPSQMARVSSSDHRPYTERFKFDWYAGTPARTKKKNKNKRVQVGQNASVDVPGYGVFHGPAWWGFGDNMDDELYFNPKDEPATGEAGGEVL